MLQEQSSSRQFIEKIFQKQYPKIIEVIIKYSSQVKVDYLQIVTEINDTLLSLVLGTMINKTVFQNLFGELKKQFKESQSVITPHFHLDIAPNEGDHYQVVHLALH
jgi:hypothetical protein